MPRRQKGTPESDLKAKGTPLFIRMSQRERKVVEYACKVRHGAVEGYLSGFSRRALLAYSKAVIKKHREKAGG